MYFVNLLTHHEHTLFLGEDDQLYHKHVDNPRETIPVTRAYQVEWLWGVSVPVALEALEGHLHKIPLERMVCLQLWGEGPYTHVALDWLEAVPDLLTEDTFSVLIAFTIMTSRQDRRVRAARLVARKLGHTLDV